MGGIGAEKGVSYITGDILYIYIIIYIYVCIYTLPKTNMEPKNEGLEDYFPLQPVIFRFHLSVFGGVYMDAHPKLPWSHCKFVKYPQVIKSSNETPYLKLVYSFFVE